MTEEQLIRLAIDPGHRARYRSLLGNPKKRARILDQLNHAPALHPKRTKWYSTFDKALKDVKVPQDAAVYLLSDSSSLDGITMTFQEAVEAVPMEGWGTLIGVNEHLAVYYGESGESAAVVGD